MEHRAGVIDLRDAKLVNAALSDVRLSEANLSNATLIGAVLMGSDLSDANLNGTILIGANMTYANFRRADLRRANLSKVNLSMADLRGADLSEVNLGKAELTGTDLSGVKLNGAKLKGADLSQVYLNDAVLVGADFTDVSLGYTSFANNDLSKVEGLETVIHGGPSTIGIDTIYKSAGQIPESFLRGCGVPNEFITYMRSLVAHPIQFYSCFISYSSRDQDFASRLYADLQNKGVRCWFAPEDLKIGDRIRDRIDESIRLRDKLLLILSEHSIASDWVEHEVEGALEEERHEGRTILIPIRLDDAVMDSSKAWTALIRRTRHIGDFREWKNHDSYQKAFDRLLRDLKAESSS